MNRPVLTILAAALALSACVSTPREPALPVLTLDAQGIQPSASTLRIDFGRDQAGVIDTVSRLLDERPQGVTVNPDCGAGNIAAATWEDGLTLNFQDGRFAGWVNRDPDLAVAGGFRAGQPRLEMPQTSFQVTTLGTEFSRSNINGILTDGDAQVLLLWAGVTCFFR